MRPYIAVAIRAGGPLRAVLVFDVHGPNTWAWTQGFDAEHCLYMAQDLVATIRDVPLVRVSVKLTYCDTGCLCPTCGLAGGFHDDVVHSRVVVPRNAIKEKGWYLADQAHTQRHSSTDRPQCTASRPDEPHCPRDEGDYT